MERTGIKRNDYVQPSECRREVVMGVCEVILRSINEYDHDSLILIRGEHPELYYGVLKDKCDHLSKTYISTVKDRKHLYDYTRIRTCEMRKVFHLLQEAGYYIFEKGWEYQISKLPYLGEEKAKHVEFKFFID